MKKQQRTDRLERNGKPAKAPKLKRKNAGEILSKGVKYGEG